MYVYSDVENGGCHCGAFAEVCNELASSFLSVKQIYLHSVPLNRVAVGLRMLVFEIVDVPQKVLLGIVAVFELDANVVVVKVVV